MGVRVQEVVSAFVPARQVDQLEQDDGRMADLGSEPKVSADLIRERHQSEVTIKAEGVRGEFVAMQVRRCGGRRTPVGRHAQRLFALRKVGPCSFRSAP